MKGLHDWQVGHASHILATLRSKRRALDASDTGTGKTYMACAVARELGIVPLVICPKTVIPSWHDAASALGIEVAAINYEKLRFTDWGHVQKVGKGSRWVWDISCELAIFDEVDRCSGETTLASKMLIAAHRQFGKVLALSATAAESPLKLKALGYLLGLHELKDFRFFLLRNGCKPGTFGGFDFAGKPEEQREAMVHLHGQIFPTWGGRLRKSEIPGFPQMQTDVVLIEDESGKAETLAVELREAYERRKAQEEEVVAANKRKREANELREIGDPEEEKEDRLSVVTRKRQALEILKVPSLVELAVEDSKSSRVAIFVNYSETLDLLQAQFRKHKIEAPIYDGRPENLKCRDEHRRDFQNGGFPIFLLNSAAGGVGISLQDLKGEAEVVQYASPMYSARVAKQLKGRANRAGGGFTRFRWVYFNKGVEAKIAAVVRRKEDNMDALNDAELNGVF